MAIEIDNGRGVHRLWVTRGFGKRKEVLCFSTDTREHFWVGVEAAVLCGLQSVRLFDTRRGAQLAAVMNGGQVEDAPEEEPLPLFLLPPGGCVAPRPGSCLLLQACRPHPAPHVRLARRRQQHLQHESGRHAAQLCRWLLRLPRLRRVLALLLLPLAA